MGVAAHNADAFEPLYTTYWDLRVTTTTKTCPTFAASFANAFAYAAQIEIIITLVLIFVFKKGRMIRDVQDVIDIGAAGVITREKAAELSNAKKSDAVDVEMPSVTKQTYNFSKASMETKCGISMTTKKDTNETAISSLDPDGLAAGCGLQEGDVMLFHHKS